MSMKKNTVEAAPRAGETTASQQLAACFQSIADSIRSKGVSGTMTPYQMPQKILDAFGRTETAATPSNLASVFSEIANSIRTVSGSQETMTPSQMPQKIQDIEVGGGYWGLKFTAEQAGSRVSFNGGLGILSLPSFVYSLDDGKTWQPYTINKATGESIQLTNVGDSVCFAAPQGVTNSYISTGPNTGGYSTFTISGKVAASGDISSLMLNDENAAKTISLPDGCYARLFYNQTGLTTAPELPATQIGQRCYYDLFYGCTSLRTAPTILPATTIGDYCYARLFWRCSQLTTSPILPITSFGSVSGAYYNMFNGCSNLSEIQVYLTSWDATGTSTTPNWVSGVSSTGTFICPTALGTNETITRGTNYCPEGWTVVNI